MPRAPLGASRCLETAEKCKCQRFWCLHRWNVPAWRAHRTNSSLYLHASIHKLCCAVVWDRVSLCSLELPGLCSVCWPQTDSNPPASACLLGVEITPYQLNLTFYWVRTHISWVLHGTKVSKVHPSHSEWTEKWIHYSAASVRTREKLHVVCRKEPTENAPLQFSGLAFSSCQAKEHILPQEHCSLHSQLQKPRAASLEHEAVCEAWLECLLPCSRTKTPELWAPRLCIPVTPGASRG